VAVTFAAALVALQLLAAPAAAAPPRWEMDIQRLPPTVKNGADAGFQITILNKGPSNISQLYLFDSPTAGPTFVETSQGTCTAVGVDLMCSFGALNAGQSVSVTVAYTTALTGNSFEYTAFANTTGVSPDQGGNSHGDALDKTVSTSLTNDKNFGGGFHVGTGAVENDTSLHPKKNKQSTQLFGVASNVIATVEDGPGIAFPCDGCDTTLAETSVINVAGGQPFLTPFRVVITVVGSFNNLDLNTVVVYHLLDDGTTLQVIGDVPAERCDSPTNPSSVPAEGCVYVSLVGTNLQVVAFVYQNGKMH
jgi:hypothetical protein